MGEGPAMTADASERIGRAATAAQVARLTGRRILFFTGLPHHYRRLEPLLARLEGVAADLRYATTQNVNFGCDFKGDFEVGLVQTGKRFLFLPGQFEREVVNQLVLDYRRADRVIAEAVRDIPEWSERLSVAAVRLRTVIALEHDRLIDRLLDAVEPELVLVLHEYNCWTRPLCARALARGVPVLSFLEGLPYETLPPGMFNGQWSSRVCLWGRSHRRRMTADGADPAKLVITGPMHLDDVRGRYLASAQSLRDEFGLAGGGNVVLLILPRLCYLPEAGGLVQSLAGHLAKREGCRLAVKWHPHERAEDIERLGISSDQVRHFQHEDVLKLIACCDAAVSTGTTAGAEVLAFGKPLIEVNWHGRRVNLSYAATGAAQEVRGEADWGLIEDVVRHGPPAAVREAAERYVADTFYRLDGHCVDRVLTQVLELVR